ncbi:unnamed protein product, partial [Mesorhabditis spiculigera]
MLQFLGISWFLQMTIAATSETFTLDIRAGLEKALDQTLNRPSAENFDACTFCGFAIGVLAEQLGQSTTEEKILEELEQPEILHVLAKGRFAPQFLCGLMLSGCGESLSDPRIELWPMDIPKDKPDVKHWPVVPSGKPTLRILHISDLHIDRAYKVGSEADCDFGNLPKKLCCRQYQGDDPTRPIKKQAGPWGTVASCDIPFQTFISALNHIKNTEKLDLIYITGDLEAHDIWAYSKTTTSANIKNITDVLNSFFPSTPIFQATGNHEGVPMDGMPQHSMLNYEKYSPGWLYSEYAEAWAPQLTPEAINQTKYRASYAMSIKKKLRLISLNTVYCSQFNMFLFLDLYDPDGTLKWLIEQLLDAESKKEKAA